MRYVYLAGPIAGMTDEDASDWRREVSAGFAPGIVGITPLRCEEVPKAGEKYQHEYFGLAECKAISTKNWFDTDQCDLVLAYLPSDRPQPSIGTTIEIGWAIGMRKPIVLVTDDPQLIGHPLIKMNVGWVVPNLHAAKAIINGLLGPYATEDVQ